MKNKLFQLLILLAILVSACTKDRVPDPSTLNSQQSIIYVENFDEAAVPFLPTSWSASPVSGWMSDSSNFSIGYTGASGFHNVSISNDTAASSVKTLYSKSISTIGYDKISIMYGARKSKHFADNGSVINISYSVDGGTTWNDLLYSDVINDSNWYPVNSSVRINLPTNASGKTSVIIRWTATLRVTPSGTYRIDDFQMYGTSV